MSGADHRLRIHRARQDFIDSLARALVEHGPGDDDSVVDQGVLHDAEVLTSFLEEARS